MFDPKTAPISRLPFLTEHGEPTEYEVDFIMGKFPEEMRHVAFLCNVSTSDVDDLRAAPSAALDP